MAQQIQTLFIDDIDGGAADGTVRFGLDGTDYEIDLSGEHTDELRLTLGKFIEHSRKVGGAARRSTTRPPRRFRRRHCQGPRMGEGERLTTSRTAVACLPISSRNTRRRPKRNRSG